MKKGFKIFAILTALAMMISLIPASSFANDDVMKFSVTVIKGKADKDNAEVGEEVKITASTPDPGKFFRCWESNADIAFYMPTYPETGFAMIKSNVTVTATYGDVLIGDIADQEYTGETLTPEVSVALNGVEKDLFEGTDYDVSFKNNVNAGTATATVTLKGDWVGSGSKDFKITPADISDAQITVEDQVYDGSELEPVPTVTWHGNVVSDGDYKVEYKNNVDVGTATVTVTGKQNFKDTTGKSETFNITKRPITFTGVSETKEYTGSEIEITVLEIVGLAIDHTHNVLFSATGINAGKYEGMITPVKDVVIRSGGTDVTKNYDVAVENGALTIDPTDEPFEISLEGSEYTYDGTGKAITNSPASTAKTGTTSFAYSFEKDGEYVDDLSSLTKTEVGTYTVYVMATNPNYSKDADEMTMGQILDAEEQELELDDVEEVS